MTGFARASGRHEALSWAWETRSVNGKGLEIRLRLPTGYERLDPLVRKAVKDAFSRGSVNLQLVMETEAAGGGWQLNDELVGQLRKFSAQVDGAEGNPLSFADMLVVRGLVEQTSTAEVDEAALDKALLADLAEALSGLATARASEGERLTKVLMEQIDGMAGLVDDARAIAGTQPEALRERLTKQLSVILEEADSLSEERLVQEVALLATRSDITEEIDRLDAHIAQAREFCGAKEPVGRRLDFLCQELNREANTICSKSSELELTRTGMALKARIEQFREQVQNIE